MRGGLRFWRTWAFFGVFGMLTGGWEVRSVWYRFQAELGEKAVF